MIRFSKKLACLTLFLAFVFLIEMVLCDISPCAAARAADPNILFKLTESQPGK